MRTQPYRNPCIITAIRDMYFSGGATSFARRFSYLFPTYESREGEVNCEVPAPMVALVATAVSSLLWLCIVLIRASCMQQSMSGALESSKLQSFRQMLT